MLEFNEYVPRGGWIKWRKRRQRLEILKAWALALALLAAFVIAGNIERGF